MQLNVNGNNLGIGVTERMLEAEIISLPGGDDSFLILSEDEHRYMQVAGSLKDGFVLEYRDGDEAKHYYCANESLSSSQVLQALKDYLNGNDNWKEDLSWSRDGALLSSGALMAVIIVLAVLIVAGVLVALQNT